MMFMARRNDYLPLGGIRTRPRWSSSIWRAKTPVGKGVWEIVEGRLTPNLTF